MLYMIKKDFNLDYKLIRSKHERNVVQVYTFSSSRKRMSTVINNTSSQFRIYTKGASEMVLALCSFYIDGNGEVKEIDADCRESLEKTLEKMASAGLRTICIAFKDFVLEEGKSFTDPSYDPENDLVCIAIMGIKDPLRPEVINAVARCKQSGITVRMITGDSKSILPLSLFLFCFPFFHLNCWLFMLLQKKKFALLLTSPSRHTATRYFDRKAHRVRMRNTNLRWSCYRRKRSQGNERGRILQNHSKSAGHGQIDPFGQIRSR